MECIGMESNQSSKQFLLELIRLERKTTNKRMNENKSKTELHRTDEASAEKSIEKKRRRKRTISNDTHSRINKKTFKIFR